MITLVLLFLICFIFSAFLAGSEMAFVSSDKLKLRDLADSGNRLAQRAMTLYRQTQRFLTTILVGTNIAHVAATAVLTYIFKIQFGIENKWVVTAVMAPLLIVLGEMVPKDYCRLHSHTFVLRYSALWLLISKFFYLPTAFCLKIVNLFLGASRQERRKSIFVNEEEFRSLIEESALSGVVSRYEKKLIDTILDFERITVAAVMTPLENVPKVDITGTVGEVARIAGETKTRMVLVYEEEPSLVVGMVYVFDLLFEKEEKTSLRNFLRSPVFLPQNTSIEKAYLTLQARRQSYAVVTDIHGDVKGAVPIERLLTR